MSDGPAIQCVDLRRTYGSGRQQLVALDGVSFEVPRGSVFGLLGPNGAGKTTMVKVLATLLTPTAGEAWVLGHDVVSGARRVRERIGLVLGGDRGWYGRLSGRENLRYFAALNGMRHRTAQRRIADLLDRFGLSRAGDLLVEHYSRGMKQRLHLARGLLMEPEVLFLDEPTIGLDPSAAWEIRRLIPELAEQGITVFLTTHYMFEADGLCHRLAVINRGKLIALGTPSDIKRRFNPIRVLAITARQPRDGVLEALRVIPGVEWCDMSHDEETVRYSIHTRQGVDLADLVLNAIGDDNVVESIAREPTLEEAYLSIIRSHTG